MGIMSVPRKTLCVSFEVVYKDIKFFVVVVFFLQKETGTERVAVGVIIFLL